MRAYFLYWNSKWKLDHSSNHIFFIGGDGQNLEPVCSLNVVRTITGTLGPDVKEQQVIFLEQANAAYTDTFANDGVLAKSMSGALNCSTLAMFEAFMASNSDVVSSFFFTIRVTFPGQLPETILRLPVNIARSVINLYNIGGVPFPAYPPPSTVFTSMNLIVKILGNGVDTGSIDFSALALAGAPSQVIPLGIYKIAAGDANIYASFIPASFTSTHANFELSGPTDRSNRILLALVIP